MKNFITNKGTLFSVLLLLLALCFFNMSFNKSSVSTAQERPINTIDITENQRILPVIMYHQVLKTRSNRYIISPSTFENDLIELKTRGYTTVLPSQVIAFAEGRGQLPKKPIMITFDDGHYNNFFYCQNLLIKYGCVAMVNVVGAYCENASSCGDDSKPMYSYLTWSQVADMARSGVWEIGNHTYNMHGANGRNGILPKKGESDAEYKKTVTADVLRLQAKLAEYGVPANVFAYPFGSLCGKSKQILIDCGFKMLLSCTESRSVITFNRPESLYQLCRFNREPTFSSKKFFDKIERSVLQTD